MRILSSGPYLTVQTLDVSRVVLLKNAWTATQNGCFLTTIDSVMPWHWSVGKILGTVWMVEMCETTGRVSVTQ